MSVQACSQPQLSGSPPQLDSRTSNLLEDFLNRKQKEKALFENLSSRSSSRSTSHTGTTRGSSVPSPASSVSPKGRSTPPKTLGPDSRNVLDLLPRSRESKGRKSAGEGGEEEVDESEASLLAQAEALADLERLNGMEPSISVAALRLEDKDPEDDTAAPPSEDRQPYEMDVDEFRRYFGENWQLSQFWYSSDFSYHLARCLYALLQGDERDPGATNGSEPSSNPAVETTTSAVDTKTKRIAFISCPTSYVGFRYLYPETASTGDSPDHHSDGVDGRVAIEPYLFDFDERLALLAPPPSVLATAGPQRFVHYDYNEPLDIPSALESTFDMVVLDPPFLNKETNLAMARTARMLLKSKEDGKILLCTGQSISEAASEIYGTPTTGPLRKAEKLEIEHLGLANDFGAWGNWDGIEEFGAKS